MTNQEAIKYLQQLYPNGGHCWLDEQRIEAIGMAVNALQEEPVSEDLEEAAKTYSNNLDSIYGSIGEQTRNAFKAGANWKRDQIAKENMLLPFKEYDNLMESINKRKKEGYEAGYKQGLVDFKKLNL